MVTDGDSNEKVPVLATVVAAEATMVVVVVLTTLPTAPT